MLQFIKSSNVAKTELRQSTDKLIFNTSNIRRLHSVEITRRILM